MCINIANMCLHGIFCFWKYGHEHLPAEMLDSYEPPEVVANSVCSWLVTELDPLNRTTLSILLFLCFSDKLHVLPGADSANMVAQWNL